MRASVTLLASVYPPGQGAALAIGRRLGGDPWLGGWSVGLICGAICWMLYGYLASVWALFGAFLTVLRFGILSQWMNGHWGGAVCALGGALLFGAIPRLAGQPRAALGARGALGWSLVLLTRPYEAVVLALLLAVLAIVGVARRRRIRLSRYVSTAGAAFGVLVSAVAITLNHDWRTTGEKIGSLISCGDGPGRQ